MNRQKGFLIPETLVLLVILAVISGFGLYIRHSVDQSKRALSNAEAASKATPAPLTKHYFPIYQWGVKGLYEGNIGLQYVIINNGHQRAYFSSDQLVSADPACSIEKGAGGYIDKYGKGELITLRDGSSETIERYVASVKPAAYKHVGKYYYVASKGKTPCGNPAKTLKLQSDTYTELQSITKSLFAYCSVLVCG